MPAFIAVDFVTFLPILAVDELVVTPYGANVEILCSDWPSFLIGDFDMSAETDADKSLLFLDVIAVILRTGVMKLCEVATRLVLFVIGDMYFFSSKNPRTGFLSLRTRGFLKVALLSAR